MRLLPLLLLIGCAHKPLHNFQRGTVCKVYIAPKNCKDLPDGKFICNGVVFDPQTVRAK